MGDVFEAFKAAVNERMTSGGTYFACQLDTLSQARKLAAAGDTISCHSVMGAPPVIYVVLPNGELSVFWSQSN